MGLALSPFQRLLGNLLFNGTLVQYEDVLGFADTHLEIAPAVIYQPTAYLPTNMCLQNLCNTKLSLLQKSCSQRGESVLCWPYFFHLFDSFFYQFSSRLFPFRLHGMNVGAPYWYFIHILKFSVWEVAALLSV